MGKNIIVHQYKAHEKTWIVPHNPKQKLKSTKVLNKAGIEVKHTAKVVGDKVLLNLRGPAMGEVQLYVVDKQNWLESSIALWNGFKELVVTIFAKVFKKS